MLSVPKKDKKKDKIYTRDYQDFKGVDFTNDPSNVWYRRSPDAVNMMPDESGKPYKRTGWETKVTAKDFARLYERDTENPAPSEITIRKCYYFELAGFDHVIIFTNYGVFVYREKEANGGENILLSSKRMNAISTISYDQDMIESYDRAFFFEGAGKSAFYIYGGYKIWEYSYNETIGFEWKAVEPYIPRVNIAVDAKHESGESYEPINMLSDYIAESFQNNIYASVSSYSTDVPGATMNVLEAMFLSMLSSSGTYVFTYTEADHSWLLNGDQVQISAYGITLSASPADGNTCTVTVTTIRRINLPKRIMTIDGLKVFVSKDEQFDTELTVEASAVHTTEGYVTLAYPQDAGNSYLIFYKDYMPIVDGEDAIKVIYPRNAVTSTTHRIPENPGEYLTINVGASNG